MDEKKINEEAEREEKRRLRDVERFKEKTREFVNAAYELSVAWETLQHHRNTEVEERANAAYPKCLPSFDEFLFDLFNFRDAVMNTEGWEVAK